MSHTSRDVIFFVEHAGLEFTRLIDPVRIRQNVLDEVTGRVSTRPDADRLFESVRNHSGVFKRGPRKFQHDALLRARHLCCLWRSAKELCVEMVSVFDDTASRDIVWIVTLSRIDRVVEFLRSEKLDRLNAVDQIVPELIQVASSWHTSRHSDNRVLA